MVWEVNFLLQLTLAADDRDYARKLKVSTNSPDWRRYCERLVKHCVVGEILAILKTYYPYSKRTKLQTHSCDGTLEMKTKVSFQFPEETPFSEQ